MRIAVLSDTHIPTRLSDIPAKTYEVCADADLILHAGDHVQKDVLDALAKLAPIKAVKGNMDGYELDHLPSRLCLRLEGFKICLTHGSGAPMGLAKRVIKAFESEEPDIIVFGHSHRFENRKIGETILLNPGAVSGRSGTRSMAVMELHEGSQPNIEQVVC